MKHFFRYLWIAPLLVALGLAPLLSCARKPEAVEENEEHAEGGEGQGEEEENAEGGEHAEGEEHKEGVVELRPEARANARIQIGRVEARPLAAAIQTTGEVGLNEDRVAHVGARVPGRIAAVRVTLGQKVGQGQALAVIDSTELAQAKADYVTARAREDLARTTFEREDRLAIEKISSQKEVLEARAALLEAEAVRRNTEETLRIFGLTSGQIRSLRSGETGASLLPVAAPFAGTIVDKEANLGEVVGTEETLFTVADLRRVWIWIDVFEKDLRRVQLGNEVSFEADAYPNEAFAGKVSFLSAGVDPGTRKVRARIDAENSDGRLRPGLFVRIQLSETQSEASEALVPTVPDSAVQRRGESFVAFVPESDSRFRMREVRVGRRSGGFVEILDGLKVGEPVVVNGVFFLVSEASKESFGSDDD